MSARTDAHRPGAILPTDYEPVLWYALATSVGGWPQPSENVNCQQHSGDRCCVVALRQSGARFFAGGGMGRCSICGASFVYGEVWQHRPTGEYIHVGHTCSDKYGLEMDRSGWEVWHAKQAALRSQAAKDKRFKTAALLFLETEPGLAEDLQLDHPILQDMWGKLHRYGSLSTKQVDCARSIANKIRNPPPPKEQELHVPAPTGRVRFTGRVVSTKVIEGPWGSTIKMVVKVETPGGCWLSWVTMPKSLSASRGDLVELKATLEPGRDAYFAFGKRPSGARIVVEHARS